MATTSPALLTPFVTGTSVVTGQGPIPLYRAYVTHDDVSVATPTWNDYSARWRSHSTSRGRESELSDFDAGTATVVFDNRDRTLDPAVNANVRPLNRLWLCEEFSGERRDLFRGYAESWTQSWDPSGIVDATATGQFVDEFKVLSLANLPTYNPPRDSYADLIEFDQPSDYWPCGDNVASNTVANQIGDALFPIAGSSGFGWSQAANYPILGDRPQNPFTTGIGGGTNTATFGYLATVQASQSGDLTGSAEFAIEFWLRVSAMPSASDVILVGPQDAGGGAKYSVTLSSTGVLTGTARTATPANISAASGAGAIAANIFYHVVLTVESNNVRLYINGSQVAATSWGGATFATGRAASAFQLGQSTGTIANMYYSNVAFYRYGLMVARVGAHYDAGVNRGFAAQTAGVRINAVLDAMTSRAPRNLAAGVRTVAGDKMSQPAINPIRSAVSAEAIDSAFFIQADGTARFLAADHRSSSPYSTVQMIFDDDGTDSPYLDCSLDYSDAFLFNEWNVTRDQGTVQTTFDTTSIVRYYKRSQSVTGLLLTTDADAATVAAAQLAKYKDPFTRVRTIKPKMADAETARLVFQRDLMDRIEFFRTPPGGGARIDQVLFIQKIEHSATPGVPPSCTLTVSPL